MLIIFRAIHSLISSLLTYSILHFRSVLLFEKYFLKLFLMVLLPSNLGFLFLSRCLIFKVQFRCLFQDSSKSIPYILFLVNTFSKLFSSFLYRLFSHPLRYPSKNACIYYHLFSLLSTVFYNFFWQFCTNSDLSVLSSGCFCALCLKHHHILYVI